MNKYQELLDLIKENPELEVIPMVDCDVCCGEEYGRWIGSFGSCFVTEYTLYQLYEESEQIVYKEDADEIEEYLVENYEGDEEKLEENIKNKMAKIKWKKAIFINIDTP